MHHKKHLLISAIIASLGGLLFGFDTAVISGTTNWLKDTFELSSFWLGFNVAIAIIGTILGALLVGKPADKYSRKNVLFILAALISWTFPLFAEVSGGHTFKFYALCMVGQLIWVLKVMPETKGITLEDIQKNLRFQ